MDISEDLLNRLRSAKHVVVFTGAGVSAESGIPTFRDALTGLWENFDAEDLATPDAFRRDPALVWGWYECSNSHFKRLLQIKHLHIPWISRAQHRKDNA